MATGTSKDAARHNSVGVVLQAEGEISDSELFRLARQGDRAAFGRRVDRHKDPPVN